jgi:probable phosphoglycerate mutase
MTERETTLLLVRHGESVVTVRGVMGGEKSCEGLSDLGRRQAEALRDRWKLGGEPTVDVLVSSTLPRARETAEVVNEHLGLVVEEYKDLEEHRPGSVDGMRFSDISQQWEAFDYIGRRHDRVADGAESAWEFFFRVSGAFEDVLATHKGKTILVACHGGVIDVAFRTFLDLPARGHFDLFTLNTSITELRVNDHGPRRGRWRLVRYNDHAHLAGLPTETPREG